MQEPGSLAGILSQSLRRRGPPPLFLVGPVDATARPAFASPGACGAALRGGCAALPPHPVAHLALHDRLARSAHRVDAAGDDARHMTVATPMLMVRSVVSVMLLRTVTTMPAEVQMPMSPMVPMTDDSAVSRTMNLGDPLRGRAFRSNLRFAPISTATPVAVCPAARCAPRRCRNDTLVARFDGVVPVTALSSSRRRCAPRSSRCSPRSPWPPAAGVGFAPGSSRRHSVRRRCRFRRSPARARRRAVASAQVRTAPPALPPTCCARPRAAPAALPAAQAPRRLRRAAVAGPDFPNFDAAR